MAPKIAPIVGFPEYLPAQQIVITRILNLIRNVYEMFGYVPLETPAVERVEHLISKGVQDKEVYGLRHLRTTGDESASALGLRFDLTVPLARYIAQHSHSLQFPFRRYQIQPVWRGERAQEERFREFIQCDVDAIGADQLSLEFDAEMPAIVFEIFRRMTIGSFTIRANNHKIIAGLFSSIGLESDTGIRSALHVVEDLQNERQTFGAAKRFQGLGISRNGIDILLEFFAIAGNNDDIIKRLKNMTVNDLFEDGVQELEYVIQSSYDNVPTSPNKLLWGDPRGAFRDVLKIDVCLARGLDYYTGTVFEGRLNDHPQIGSICGGGRYDNLVGSFGDRAFPGVGISIDFTRLVNLLFTHNILKAASSAIAPVLVVTQERQALQECKNVATILRAANIPAEVFFTEKDMKAQLRYAQQRGFPVVVFGSIEELKQGVVIARNMSNGQEEPVHLSQLGVYVKMLVPPENENWLARDVTTSKVLPL